MGWGQENSVQVRPLLYIWSHASCLQACNGPGSVGQWSQSATKVCIITHQDIHHTYVVIGAAVDGSVPCVT